MNFDFAVVGNGSIGCLTALELLKTFPDSTIALIGPKRRPQSASLAAGAMANVYAEIESVPVLLEKDMTNALAVGRDGSRMWREFLHDYGLSEIVTAEDTIVYLQDDASDFERDNFRLSLGRVLQDSMGESLDETQIKNIFSETHDSKIAAYAIHGEFAIDTQLLFAKLDELLANTGSIFVIDTTAINVNPDSREIELESGSVIKSGRIVVANGSHASQVLPPGMITRTLSGFGTAIEVNHGGKLPEGMLGSVIRTVNRGGAQCGLHTVPRKGDRLYIGAGNTIQLNAPSSLRMETARYLIDRFQEEFVGRQAGYDLDGRFIFGARPRTIDGFPSIGPIRDGKTFVVTGTNRAGLTWSPRLAREVAKWFDRETSSPEFSGWHPERELRPFGTEAESVRYFVNSRLAAAQEHGLASGKEGLAGRKKELEKVAEDLLTRLKLHHPNICKTGLIHPDHWTLLTREDFRQTDYGSSPQGA
jgi:glycine oxidase